MARKSFKAGALTAPLPPVMVTVGDMQKHNVITIGWTGILSTVPPRTYISVRPERYSYKMLKSNGEFVINLTTADQARIVDYVGIYTGAKVDKFRECSLTAEESREVAPPTIKECPLALECRVVEIIPMGSHDVFIADIVSVSCDEGILDRDGRICFDKADLMAYAHGEYFALGEKLGKFGFSTKKDKKSADKGTITQADRSTEGKGSVKKAFRDSKNESLREAAASGKKPQKNNKEDRTGYGENKKRPFYLDAPRGRKNGGSKKSIRKNK